MSAYDLEVIKLQQCHDTDVIDLVGNAYEQRKPFSLIRCGDGEGVVLGFPEFVHPDRHMKWMRAFFGPHADNGANFDNLSIAMKQAIKASDVLGGHGECFKNPDKAVKISVALGSIRYLTNEQKKEISYVERRLLWESLKVLIQAKTEYSSAAIHRRLEESGFLRNVLSRAAEISLITGNDLEGKFSKSFPNAKINVFPVPTEFKWSDRKDEFGHGSPHFPDVYEKIIHEIQGGSFGDIVLIGAGPCGKVYASEVKKSGGFAIDVGSLMDVWDNRRTRSYIGSIKQATFEGSNADGHNV